MNRRAAATLYVLAMIAVIVGVDVTFFRGRILERLLVNVGIVAIFVTFYVRSLKQR